MAFTAPEHGFRGVFPAVTTQFHADESLNLPALRAHLDRLLQAGVQGFVMLGSLGENNSLEPAEKAEIVRCAVVVSAGRVPVVAGVSELSTTKAIRHVQAMRDAGATGLMVMPAMVYPADRREAHAYFRAVAAATELPIILYNNPLAYPVDLRPHDLAELADEPKFVAVKESSGDPRRFTDIVNLLGDRYTLMAGVDDLALECGILGAQGWIAGVGLAFPEENQHLWNLMQAERWEEARQLYRWLTPALHLDVGPKFVQCIKLLIQEVGLGAEWVRAPRLPLAGSEREQALAVIAETLRTRPNLP